MEMTPVADLGFMVAGIGLFFAGPFLPALFAVAGPLSLGALTFLL